MIVDTSVWVRFLAGRLDQLATLHQLLDRQEVAAHALVYGELLIGDNGGRAGILEEYSAFTWAVEAEHSEVVYFVRKHKLNGRGISWVDAHILLSAALSRGLLWTEDRRLRLAAESVGLAYFPPTS